MTSVSHIPSPMLQRYALADARVAADAVWAIEAHLEACSPCREQLGRQVIQHSPQTAALLLRVQERLAADPTYGAQMPPQRRLRRLGRWMPPGLWPRLATTLAVIGAALGLDLAGTTGLLPSVVLLVAPVAPLLGVTAVWSAGLDPVHELVLASPRAGLSLVLRRTLAVLVVVIPALTVAGWFTGASPAAWLLPCMAFTASALALGEVLGLRWAALVLGLAWTAGVIAPVTVHAVTAPDMLAGQIPWLLRPASVPYWTGLVIAIAFALLARRDAYTGMRRQRWFVR